MNARYKLTEKMLGYYREAATFLQSVPPQRRGAGASRASCLQRFAASSVSLSYAPIFESSRPAILIDPDWARPVVPVPLAFAFLGDDRYRASKHFIERSRDANTPAG